MPTQDPFLLSMQLTRAFGELVGHLWGDPSEPIFLEATLVQLLRAVEAWWETTRPAGIAALPLPTYLSGRGSLTEAANALVNPFGNFLAEALATPLSPPGASRLTVASHVVGLAIHVWRHWEDAHELRCVAELAGEIPHELLLCAIGQRGSVPAPVLRGYLPETPRFVRDAAQPIPIGWDTGHHVAFVCAERGLFANECRRR